MAMESTEQLGKYQLETVLGRGSMGVVYRARDLALGHTVAIKTLRKEALDDCHDGSLLQRFKNEALAGRRLKHRNIVSIYDYGEAKDSYYLVMEFVKGKTLRDYFKEDYRFTLAETATLMRQLLDALDYAHRNGVVHRDINPNNLLVTAHGELVIMDFGIAKIDASGLTRTGVVLGTPAYMSPEQCMGQPVDHRSDIFSAGVILYQLLTGKRPFNGNSALSTMQQILNLTPIKPSVTNAQISTAVDRIVAKALAKSPEERFATARGFADTLFASLDPAPVPKVVPEALYPKASVSHFAVAAPRPSVLTELGAAILGGFGAVALVWYVAYSVAPLAQIMDQHPARSSPLSVKVEPQATSYDPLKAALSIQSTGPSEHRITRSPLEPLAGDERSRQNPPHLAK